MTSKKVYLSPTSLIAFYGDCPATLHFSQIYRRIEDGTTNTGSEVHKHMQDSHALPDIPDNTERMLTDKLRKIESNLGVQPGRPEWNEIKQVFEIGRGIVFTRIIDRLAQLASGEWIVCDYKTALNAWPILYRCKEPVSPKACTFQAPGYLIPPPDKFLQKEIKRLNLPANFTWPTKMVFAVAPIKGGAQVFPFQRNNAAEANFMRAVEFAAKVIRKGDMIYNYGSACVKSPTWACNYKEVCWGSDGWKSIFRERDGEMSLAELEEME